VSEKSPWPQVNLYPQRGGGYLCRLICTPREVGVYSCRPFLMFAHIWKFFHMSNLKLILLFFFKDFIYLFERAREGEGQREKQTPRQTGSPMWDPIPGLQDHDLSRRQSLNQLSHPGAQEGAFHVRPEAPAEPPRRPGGCFSCSAGGQSTLPTP